MAEDLSPGTHGLICKLVPLRGLEIKVEQLSTFAKCPLEVTVRAACGNQATFLYSWGIAADEMGFPRYETRPIAIICPPDMLMQVYEMAKEEAKREMMA